MFFQFLDMTVLNTDRICYFCCAVELLSTFGGGRAQTYIFRCFTYVSDRCDEIARFIALTGNGHSIDSMYLLLLSNESCFVERKMLNFFLESSNKSKVVAMTQQIDLHNLHSD